MGQLTFVSTKTVETPGYTLPHFIALNLSIEFLLLLEINFVRETTTASTAAAAAAMKRGENG